MEFIVKESKIHGIGVFSNEPIKSGEILYDCFTNISENSFMETYLAKYTNHSKKPTADLFKKDDNTVSLISIQDIDSEEITCNYESFIKFFPNKRYLIFNFETLN